MVSTYVNNLRLEEMATGEKSGTWGNITNVNLELVGQALGYGTRAIANASTDNITIADGASDADRSMYLKLTGGGQACTITLLPNTSSKMWVMENATSYTLTFSQGSGANVAIPAGQTKMIFADGLGGGAVVYEIGTIAVGGVQSNGTVTVGVDDTGHDVTFFGATAGKKLLWDESADALIVTGDGTFQGLDTSAISGIVESNANFIDMCLVGPSVDGMSWNGYFSNGAVWTSLMLATVETSGSDAQVNIWDLTAGTLASATPLATLTLTGATPTSIAASMGYIIVGTSDQGMHIVAPHDTGAWAEKTQGWPRSLSASTGPALTDNNVQSTAVTILDDAPFDSATGGKVPSFVVGLGATKDFTGILDNGTVLASANNTSASNIIGIHNDFLIHEAASAGNTYFGSISYARNNASWSIAQLDGSGAYPLAGTVNSMRGGFDQFLVGRSVGLIAYQGSYFPGSVNNSILAGNRALEAWATVAITRAFNSGNMPGQVNGSCKLAALANSDTADRSGNGHTLTENGTVVEAAVASGAELKAYSSWSASNFLSSSDAAFDVGDSTLLISCWFKLTASETNHNVITEYFLDGAAATDARWLLSYYQPSDALYFFVQDQGGTALEVNATGLGIDDDGLWHHVAASWTNVTHTASVYMDGVPVKSGTNTGVGTLTNTSNTFKIGTSFNAANGFNADRPFGGSLSLFRLSSGSSLAVTETQIKKMYEAEAPMFAANAKCLLQSGSTDAVLDATVDPLSGKYIVTQTDSQEIFDGLAIETERTIATGGSTFEHGLLWGDAVSEINNANLFASTPATDQRQVNEMVRSLSADLPAGVDLSKAKAWVYYNGVSNVINSSFNVESLTDNGTGTHTITFANNFKSQTTLSGVASSDQPVTKTTGTTVSTLQIITQDASFASADASIVFAVCFGELENE